MESSGGRRGLGCAGLGRFANIRERGIIATSQTRSDQHLQPPDRAQREERAGQRKLEDVG